MSEKTIEATSAPAPVANADGKRTGNLTAAQATQQLLARYMPKPAETAEATTPAKTEATEVAKAAEAAVPENAATSSVTEPPASEAKSAEPTTVDEAAPAAAETTAEGAPEDEPEGEDVLSQDTTLTPEEKEKFRAVRAAWQEGINKRIGKEKRKRLDAEAKAQILEARLTEQQRAAAAMPPPEPVIITAPTPDNPLADVVDFPALAKRQREANEAINTAQTLIDQMDDAGQSEMQVGQNTYTKAALREVRREAERTLREHIPARQQFILARQQAQQGVLTDFPELADRNSKAHQEMMAVKARYPMLAHLPDADYWIGLAMEGAKALQAKKAAKPGAGGGNGAKAATPAPQPAPSNKPPAAAIATGAAVNSAARGRVTPQASYEAEKKRVFGGKNVSAAEATALLLKRELSNLR